MLSWTQRWQHLVNDRHMGSCSQRPPTPQSSLTNSLQGIIPGASGWKGSEKSSGSQGPGFRAQGLIRALTALAPLLFSI